MATLIFQVQVRQWEKNQHTLAAETARKTLANEYVIHSQPQYVIFDTPCIIDQHGEALPSKVFSTGRVKTALLKDGSVTLDRFHISQQDEQMVVSYQPDNQSAQLIGNLKEGWIQGRYRWRYRDEMNGEIFWRYEEFILNAGYAESPSVSFFINTEPAFKFVDDQLPPLKA